MQEKNIQRDIKGILLYSEYNFFKVLEGERKQVLEIYERIKKYPRHHSIIQILGKDISHGSYDSYRASIIKGKEKGDHYLSEQYLEPLKGMDKQVRQLVEIFVRCLLIRVHR